jgi:hypothetical protein
MYVGRKVRLLNPPSSVNCMLEGVYTHSVPTGHIPDRTSREHCFAQLAHFCQRPNLRFQSLIVLPLDLQFRL